MSSCIHLVRVALVSGHSVKTEFKFLRTSCALKERDQALRDQMNVAHRDRRGDAAHLDECPFAAAGDFGACRWHQS